MLNISIISQESAELAIIRTLFEEYAAELNENLCFQRFDEEVEHPLQKYGPPKGCLLLAEWNGEAAGCIAFTALQNASCEMKRLYVRPLYRKLGIGDELVKAILTEAVKTGYSKMLLDTLEKLQSAIRLYEKYGFRVISSYYSNPLNNVVYMEKVLRV